MIAFSTLVTWGVLLPLWLVGSMVTGLLVGKAISLGGDLGGEK